MAVMTALDSIAEAANRINIQNVWYLLLYAWDMAAWRGRWQRASEASPPLLGLLARVLAESTRDLLRYQLGRSYTQRKETIPGVRGRVDFATSLKRRTFDRAATHCAFSELSVDTLKNRILRGTLHRLASDARLKHANKDSEARLRHDIRSVVRALEGISIVPIGSADFGRLQLSENDRPYALPLAICALIHRLEMPTEASGDHALTALLKDELVFHQLFERFVRNFYRLHLSAYWVKPERLSWFDTLGSSFVPEMLTDISIVGTEPPYRRLIVDTKYSVRTLSDRMKFKSENLYQIYAYLRTQEHLSEAHGEAEGMLLYPTIEVNLDEAMVVQGHRIRVATLDLSQSWGEIEERLLDFIGVQS